jgi:hypothetical protein
LFCCLEMLPFYYFPHACLCITNSIVEHLEALRVSKGFLFRLVMRLRLVNTYYFCTLICFCFLFILYFNTYLCVLLGDFVHIGYLFILLYVIEDIVTLDQSLLYIMFITVNLSRNRNF